ncbi:hypothetical protein [Nitrosomonas sp. Nm34]|uniref:hypothetical protein n=1 Tax=Nitrosomonas sp. Nm34 TaxID=1881055 RepID=UPI0008E5BC8A|nr:hypothetical protein [Nitrosomonas sp. Nm34]SFI90742.1 hypothetical protein SAMN05428978_10565 [Nitrosomonas sp. Nm34]
MQQITAFLQKSNSTTLVKPPSLQHAKETILFYRRLMVCFHRQLNLPRCLISLLSPGPKKISVFTLYGRQGRQPIKHYDEQRASGRRC